MTRHQSLVGAGTEEFIGRSISDTSRLVSRNQPAPNANIFLFGCNFLQLRGVPNGVISETLMRGRRESGTTMRKKAGSLKVAFVVVILALYITVLVRGTTESTRRVLQLRDETPAQDRVAGSVLVTNVDLATQELTAQLDFRFAGSIARDEVTPAVDLTLLINNVGDEQQFDFPRGKRTHLIQAVFPLNGDLNRYPFDRYETTMWFLITAPEAVNKTQVSKVPEDESQEPVQSNQLAIGSVTLQHNKPIPLSLNVSAAIRGIKFQGSVARNATTQVVGIGLNLRRADNLIAVAILINAMMIGLAISVLAMVLHVRAASGESDLVPLSSSISLIFGLPALRNVQPGVPSVGAFSDYVIFIWAELIVAVSTVVTVWHWLLRARPESESQ
jgi:hypothetical protein